MLDSKVRSYEINAIEIVKKTPAMQVLTFIETFRDFYDWDN